MNRFVRCVYIAMRCVAVRRYQVCCSGRLPPDLLAKKGKAGAVNGSPNLFTPFNMAVRMIDGHAFMPYTQHRMQSCQTIISPKK